MTTSLFDFTFHCRPLFDVGCFVVSWDGLPICATSDPVMGAAHFLKKAGVADETGFDMWLEGSGIGASYSVGRVISTSEYGPKGVESRAGSFLMR